MAATSARRCWKILRSGFVAPACRLKIAALAKALALLGQSHLSSNLNQLAYLANTGSLPLTPETEAQLQEAYAVICEIRALLLQALGQNAGGSA